MNAMVEIRETFFQECDEQLGELEAGLLAMDEGRSDVETVNAVFRAVHSIKGGAGAFQLNELVQFAHTFESTLELIRKGTLTVSKEIVRTLLKAADLLTDLIQVCRTEQDIDPDCSRAIIGELRAYSCTSSGVDDAQPSAAVDTEVIEFQPIQLCIPESSEAAKRPEEEKQVYAISFRPAAAMYQTGNDGLYILRELARLGGLELSCDATAVPQLNEIDPEGAYLTWEMLLTSDCQLPQIHEIFEFVVDECELAIAVLPSRTLSGSGEARIAEQPNCEEPVSLEVRTPTADGLRGSGLWPIMPAIDNDSVAAMGSDDQEDREAEVGRKSSSLDSNTAAPSAGTIRVDLERVDRLINLVGELVINQAMLSQLVFDAGIARARNVAAGLDELEQLSREIQESVMAIRAQPVKPLFQRMGRIVREVSDATGKVVRLRTEGESTEIDRTVIERLADPLTHMIRNAIDHGLEKPDARRASGKPEQGEVLLTAAHRSGRVVIEISDDGAGINRELVKKIAIQKKLVGADVQLNEAEIDNLLFLPGFSTADQVSSISGRGVGMDVVKRSIQVLGGTISISSRPGIGTKFSMSLPLTLAVLDGMVVKAADQSLLVPLAAIVETLKPSMHEIHEIGTGGLVLANRGGFIPMIDVAKVLGFSVDEPRNNGRVVIMVETQDGNRTALLVDEIRDQRQVVIKSLAANYGQVAGIAAATILGDGRIALILDVDAIVATAGKSSVGV